MIAARELGQRDGRVDVVERGHRCDRDPLRPVARPRPPRAHRSRRSERPRDAISGVQRFEVVEVARRSARRQKSGSGEIAVVRRTTARPARGTAPRAPARRTRRAARGTSSRARCPTPTTERQPEHDQLHAAARVRCLIRSRSSASTCDAAQRIGVLGKHAFERRLPDRALHASGVSVPTGGRPRPARRAPPALRCRAEKELLDPLPGVGDEARRRARRLEHAGGGARTRYAPSNRARR